jgi:hypothetical protein
MRITDLSLPGKSGAPTAARERVQVKHLPNGQKLSHELRYCKRETAKTSFRVNYCGNDDPGELVSRKPNIGFAHGLDDLNLFEFLTAEI